MSRNSESLNFIVLKTNNLETKIPGKKIAQNNRVKSATFLKNWLVISNILHGD